MSENAIRSLVIAQSDSIHPVGPGHGPTRTATYLRDRHRSWGWSRREFRSPSLGLPDFLRSKSRSFLRDLAPDHRGHVGVDTDERDGVIDESDLDIPTRRQPSFQVPAHSQVDEAIVALGRGRENVRAEVREILAAPRRPTRRECRQPRARRARNRLLLRKGRAEPPSICRFAMLSQVAWSSYSNEYSLRTSTPGRARRTPVENPRPMLLRPGTLPRATWAFELKYDAVPRDRLHRGQPPGPRRSPWTPRWPASQPQRCPAPLAQHTRKLPGEVNVKALLAATVMRRGDRGIGWKSHYPTKEESVVLATAKIEDFDRFWNTFSTKGAEKRKQHGSKGAHVFQDPNESDRVWVIFDWDEEGWKNFTSDPDVPGIFQEAGFVGGAAQVGGVPSQ